MSIGLKANMKCTFLYSNVFYFGKYVPQNDPQYGKINGYIHKNSSTNKTTRLVTFYLDFYLFLLETLIV